MGIKLQSLRFSNYLGVASEAVEIQFHPRCTVFCGPNNSGKTTVLSAASLLFEAMRTSAYSSRDGALDLSAGTESPLTHEMLNFRTQSNDCPLDAVLSVDRSLLTFSLDGAANEPTRMRLGVILAQGQKRLQYLTLNSQEVFLPNVRTAFFAPDGSGHYVLLDTRCNAILQLPTLLADRKVFVPSLRSVRGPQGGQIDNLQQLAEGIGINSWVLTSMNPDARDRLSIQRYKLLKEFESEFGNFAGFPSCLLSVGGNELNVHIDSHPVPISRLGAGIGECLLILLVCKLARELPTILHRPPIELLLIEEPELHLHPRLQRMLLSYLLKYAESNDTQLILSTHSATVLNAVYLAGGSVYRTEYDRAKPQVLVNPVRATDRLLALLKDIGASPGDLLQADKVLWVEGPRDIPVFKAWLSIAPSFQNQTVSVLSLGGDDPASDDFDIDQLLVLNPNCLVVLDSEKTGPNASAKQTRLTTERKCRQAGIPCLLTERRSTENYFTYRALSTMYSGFKSEVEPYAKLTDYDTSFSKEDNGRIAAAMDWSDLAATDIGQALEDFLNR